MDREKVIKELTNLPTTIYDGFYQLRITHEVRNKVIALLNEQEEKAGKWIPVTNGRGGMECSICHNYAPSYQSCAEYLSKYCPNCGAKMEGWQR